MTDKTAEHRLFEAIKNDRDQILEVLQEMPDLTMPVDLEGSNYIQLPINAMIASYIYNDIVRDLLDKNPQLVNSIDDRQHPSPLYTAISCSNVDMEDELLSRGANINGNYPTFDMQRDSVLGLAVEKDQLNLAQRLVEAGAVVNDVNSTQPILHRVRSVEMCEYLLSQGANVNAQDFELFNETPLHIAIDNNRYDIVATLLDAGADTTIKSFNGQGKSPEEASEFVRSYSQKKRLEQSVGEVVNMDDVPVRKRRM